MRAPPIGNYPATQGGKCGRLRKSMVNTTSTDVVSLGTERQGRYGARFHYVDDAFSFDPDEDLKYYQPYDDWFPSKQVSLLSHHRALHQPRQHVDHYASIHYGHGNNSWVTATGL